VSEWQPIETAPKDGTIFLAYYNDDPALVSWVELPIRTVVRRVGRLWWRREIVEERVETGFRVMTLIGRGWTGFTVHGSFPPFTPKQWAPIPQPKP